MNFAFTALYFRIFKAHSYAITSTRTGPAERASRVHFHQRGNIGER
jgi:hypothetical protein